MSIRQIRRRLERVESWLLPSDDDSCTLEELSRAIWQRDSKKYRKMALEISGMDCWIEQFEREDEYEARGESVSAT
jgi:hypothetical protein